MQKPSPHVVADIKADIKAAQLAALNALFTEIDSEFGKAAKKKPSAAIRKPKAPSSPADASLQEHLTESNKLALLMDSPTWQPKAIVHYVIHQNCRNCNQSTEYIGGVLIQHRHKIKGDIWEYPRPFLPQFANLPRILKEARTQVEYCASCLRDGLGLTADPEQFTLDLSSEQPTVDSEYATEIAAKRRADALDMAAEFATEVEIIDEMAETLATEYAEQEIAEDTDPDGIFQES